MLTKAYSRARTGVTEVFFESSDPLVIRNVVYNEKEKSDSEC